VYTGGDLAGICESQGIKQEISAPYVHTNAAVAERLWRTLLDITRALLSTSGLSHDYWPLAARHATYLYVRRPHGSLEMTSPYEQIFHVKPDISHLRVFGCTAFFHIDDNLRTSKLNEKAVSGIYVGHLENSTSVLICNPVTSKVVHRGHVHFIEDVDCYGKVVAHHKAPPTPLLDTSDQPELLTLPVGVNDCQSVPVFTRVTGHAVYYDGEHETLGLVKIVTPESPAGVWVYFHALLHEDSQSNAAEKMIQYDHTAPSAT